MAAAMCTGGKTTPSERHIAFAISIVTSKPKGCSVAEYIRMLRQHIAKGRRENALSSVHRHLDRSAYWRSECERLKEALRCSEVEQHQLKLEVDGLKAKAETSKPAGAAKKRRKVDEDVIPVPRSPKRAKLEGSRADVFVAPFDVGVDLDLSILGATGGGTLTRSLYQLHAVQKVRGRTDPTLLAHHLVQAGEAVTAILEHGSNEYLASKNLSIDSFHDVLVAANRSMHSLTAGYSRLCNNPKGAEVQGHVVYAYVKILETCVLLMDKCAKAEVERTLRGAAAGPATTRPSTAKGKTKQTQQATTTKSDALEVLCKFVISTIGMLDAKSEAHKALFEGIAYFVIETLGSCLYTLVFGYARGKTIEEEIAAGDRKDDIEETDGTPRPRAEEVQVKAAKLEAPYLVHLLSRIMQLAPDFFGAALANKTGKAKPASKATLSKVNLAITARERLQRTLLNAIFGEEPASEDDPFIDCLRRPALAGATLSVPAVKEVEVQEWFKKEVWQLLGWDILSREDGW